MGNPRNKSLEAIAVHPIVEQLDGQFDGINITPEDLLSWFGDEVYELLIMAETIASSTDKRGLHALIAARINQTGRGAGAGHEIVMPQEQKSLISFAQLLGFKIPFPEDNTEKNETKVVTVSIKDITTALKSNIISILLDEGIVQSETDIDLADRLTLKRIALEIAARAFATMQSPDSNKYLAERAMERQRYYFGREMSAEYHKGVANVIVKHIGNSQDPTGIAHSIIRAHAAEAIVHSAYAKMSVNQ